MKDGEMKGTLVWRSLKWRSLVATVWRVANHKGKISSSTARMSTTAADAKQKVRRTLWESLWSEILNWQGNEAFKAADYATAIGHYSAAVLADRQDPTLPLNRAAAYLKLGK